MLCVGMLQRMETLPRRALSLLGLKRNVVEGAKRLLPEVVDLCQTLLDLFNRLSVGGEELRHRIKGERQGCGDMCRRSVKCIRWHKVVTKS